VTPRSQLGKYNSVLISYLRSPLAAPRPRSPSLLPHSNNAFTRWSSEPSGRHFVIAPLLLTHPHTIHIQDERRSERERQGCLCGSFRDVGIEDEPVDDGEPVQIHGETEKSQEEFSIGGAHLRIPSSLVWDFLDLDSGSL